jgi:hypothetical protein
MIARAASASHTFDQSPLEISMNSCTSRFGILVAVVAAAGLAGAATTMLLTPSPAVAQAGASTSAQRIATLDALAVVERMILSERYKPARDKVTEEKNVKLKVLSDSLRGVEERAKGLAQDSPELQALAQEYQQTSQRLQDAERQAVGELDVFNAEQIAEAYRLVVEAANTMAASKGYTHVVQTRIGDVKFRSKNVTGIIQEVLARPVIQSPTADDITQALITQFGVENVSIEPEAIAAPNAVPGAAPSVSPAEPAPAATPK